MIVEGTIMYSLYITMFYLLQDGCNILNKLASDEVTTSSGIGISGVLAARWAPGRQGPKTAPMSRSLLVLKRPIHNYRRYCPCSEYSCCITYIKHA